MNEINRVKKSLLDIFLFLFVVTALQGSGAAESAALKTAKTLVFIIFSFA